jgi:C-methyltransferase-like protein/putative zinc binding protein/methyltransferase family protein
MSSFERVDACRICGNTNLATVVDLGDQYLTGVFPKSRDQPVTRGPLELVRCTGGQETCGLVQLHHAYDPGEMYGQDYGYRSSLNRAMVKHLRSKADRLIELSRPGRGDLVLDIGSNDGTLLSFYPADTVRVGMDPSAAALCESYPEGCDCIVDFFSLEGFRRHYANRKARVVTSIAMFYDLADPQLFVNEVAEILDDDGVWHFEQSYLPFMLRTTGYDTICHEHVEYYGLAQIEWMLDKAGLRLIDVELNDVNGGSFAITACRTASRHKTNTESVQAVRSREADARLRDASTYARFADNVQRHRDELKLLLQNLRSDGQLVLGYGASTKGNVLLQFCGLGANEIPYIAEVNENKFGSLTPGSMIPIISEADAHAMAPDYFLVMPWHFRDNLVQREQSFLERGGKMIFPLPALEVVGRPET